MLEPYSFTPKGKRKNNNGSGHFTEVFTFYDFKGRKFIVEAERFDENLYAIKFYPHHYRDSEKKFQVITNYGQPGRLIGTCISLIKHLYGENPQASFGIIGINSVGEQKANTKRYRTYCTAISNKIAPVNFEHKKYDDQSLYVLVNRNGLKANPSLVQNLENVIRPVINDHFKEPEKSEKKHNVRHR